MPQFEQDRSLIENVATVHEANAELHLKRADEQQRAHQTAEQRPRMSQSEMLAASGLVIAASYWSLIDPRRAVSLYRRAARNYQSLGHDYAMTLALASASRDEVPEMLSAIDENRSPRPHAIAFAMIGNEVSNSDLREERAERLDSVWRHTGNVPIGRLGIPLDHYGRCAQAMRVARKDNDEEFFFAEASNYVHRAAEVLRSASHDRFHWLQLRSSILPAEPEAVAVTAAMSMMSYSLFGIPISNIPNLDEHGRLLVEVGDDMRDAGGPTKDNPPRNNPPDNNPPRNKPPRRTPPRASRILTR